MQKLPFVSALFLFSILLLSANVTFAQKGRVDQRIRHQRHRIDRAAAEGRISERQADSLRRHLRHIRLEFESARDQGTLDFNKIRWLNRELDNNSMRIDRMENGWNGRRSLRQFH